MNQPTVERLCIIGVGLIGGSIGMAVRQCGWAKQVVGVGRDTQRLEIALQRGALDKATTDLEEGVQEADLVVICTPVSAILPTLQQCLAFLPTNCVVTDVGSVKAEIVRRATELLGGRFVGGHPMAGSEQVGVQHARADLFLNTTWAITPVEQTEAEAIHRVEALAEALGARVILADPEEHDRAVALTSHLPHAVALALVRVAEKSYYPQLIGGSFRDGTRVAASSPELWRDIFMYNRDYVLWAIDEFLGKLEEVRSAIAEEDAETIQRLFVEARMIRQAFGL